MKENTRRSNNIDVFNPVGAREDELLKRDASDRAGDICVNRILFLFSLFHNTLCLFIHHDDFLQRSVVFKALLFTSALQSIAIIDISMTLNDDNLGSCLLVGFISA